MLSSQDSVEEIKGYNKTNHSIMINISALILDGWLLNLLWKYKVLIVCNQRNQPYAHTSSGITCK